MIQVQITFKFANGRELSTHWRNMATFTSKRTARDNTFARMRDTLGQGRPMSVETQDDEETLVFPRYVTHVSVRVRETEES